MLNINKILSFLAVGSSLAAVILFFLVTTQRNTISSLKQDKIELKQEIAQKDKELAMRIRQHEEDLETSKRQEELLSSLEQSKDVDNLNHVPDESILMQLRRD
jgi:cell division protein FtsX